MSESFEVKNKSILFPLLALFLLLFFIAGMLHLFQQSLLTPRSAIILPQTSPLAEEEFESGELRIKAERAAEAKIHSYHWVDKKRGLVSIPIERAMSYYLEKRRASP